MVASQPWRRCPTASITTGPVPACSVTGVSADSVEGIWTEPDLGKSGSYFVQCALFTGRKTLRASGVALGMHVCQRLEGF